MTHTDQLTFIIKYVSPNGRIHKDFLKLGILQEMGMDRNIYRDRFYNNGGLVAVKSQAEWGLCTADKLNLVRSF